jgi:uncharacterized protein
MTAKFRKVFGNTKPVIAMVHIGALPGSPLYDSEGGLERLIADARISRRFKMRALMP